MEVTLLLLATALLGAVSLDLFSSDDSDRSEDAPVEDPQDDLLQPTGDDEDDGDLLPRPTDGDDDLLVSLDALDAGIWTLDGGAGDDTISTDIDGADLITLRGGDGNDTLDGSLNPNVALFGDAGNDTLILSQHAPSGAGYNISADGGDGDDTLVLDAPPQVWDANLPRLTGGAGADRYEISFDESFTTFENADGPASTPWGDTPPVRSNLAVITDFDPDEDEIEIALDVADPDYAIVSAVLEEGPALDRVLTDTQPAETVETADTETRIIVNYESASGDLREMVVIVQATGLTWDNVSFAGMNVPPVLG